MSRLRDRVKRLELRRVANDQMPFVVSQRQEETEEAAIDRVSAEHAIPADRKWAFVIAPEPLSLLDWEAHFGPGGT